MAKKKQFPSLFDVKEFISILDDRRFECPDGDRKTPLQNRREKSVRCLKSGCSRLAKKISEEEL